MAPGSEGVDWITGRLEGGFPHVCAKKLIETLIRKPKSAPNARALLDRADIACSFRIDRCTCVLAPAGPDTLPGQARVPPPSGSCRRARGPVGLRMDERGFCRPTPLARKRPTKMAPSLPALTSPIRGVQVATWLDRRLGEDGRRAFVGCIWRGRCRGGRCDRESRHTAPGWGGAITGRLEQIPMFAQVSFYRKHQGRARDRAKQPARADRRRLPPQN